MLLIGTRQLLWEFGLMLWSTHLVRMLRDYIFPLGLYIFIIKFTIIYNIPRKCIKMVDRTTGIKVDISFNQMNGIETVEYISNFKSKHLKLLFYIIM